MTEVKSLRHWIIYLILWIAALSLAVFNNATGNHVAWQQWAIAQAVLCGLMVGEGRNTDPREITLDQLASISLFLAIGIPLLFYPTVSYWGIPWFVPSVVCALSFLYFSLRLYFLQKKRKATDTQEDGQAV